MQYNSYAKGSEKNTVFASTIVRWAVNASKLMHQKMLQTYMTQHEQTLKQKEEQLTRQFEALKLAHKEEEQKLSNKLGEVEKSRDKFKDQCTEFSHTLKKLEQVIETKQTENQQLQVKARNLEEDKKESQQALNEIKAENASLSDTIKAIKVELKSAKAKKGLYLHLK